MQFLFKNFTSTDENILTVDEVRNLLQGKKSVRTQSFVGNKKEAEEDSFSENAQSSNENFEEACEINQEDQQSCRLTKTVSCPCSEHLEKIELDSIFPLTPRVMFDLIFGTEALLKSVHLKSNHLRNTISLLAYNHFNF